MTETKVAKKNDKEKDIKPKKIKKVDVDEKVIEDVKVDVEIDCTTNCCSNSSNQCVYIRHKRSI